MYFLFGSGDLQAKAPIHWYRGSNVRIGYLAVEDGFLDQVTRVKNNHDFRFILFLLTN